MRGIDEVCEYIKGVSKGADLSDERLGAIYAMAKLAEPGIAERWDFERAQAIATDGVPHFNDSLRKWCAGPSTDPLGDEKAARNQDWNMQAGDEWVNR